MSGDRGLLILGFGGHARSVADVALACGFRELQFVDQNARDGESFLGFPVLKHHEKTLPDGWSAFPAAGDNGRRSLQYAEMLALGWQVASLIAPSASIGVGSRISAGTFVGHHAHVGPMATVGNGCIINTGAVIEHECVVGDYVHVSVNATLAGRSRLGMLSMLGAGACVIDGIDVADGVIIGAGAIVLRSIRGPGT